MDLYPSNIFISSKSSKFPKYRLYNTYILSVIKSNKMKSNNKMNLNWCKTVNSNITEYSSVLQFFNIPLKGHVLTIELQGQRIHCSFYVNERTPWYFRLLYVIEETQVKLEDYEDYIGYEPNLLNDLNRDLEEINVNRKEIMTMILIGRELSPQSPLYKEKLPLDMLKEILIIVFKLE